MAIGIRFISSDSFVNTIERLGIYVEDANHLWYVDNIMINIDHLDSPDLDDEEYALSWGDLLEYLHEAKNKLVQTMRIRRYAALNEIAPIEVYTDYITSACSLTLLFMDCWEYEIYSKDPDQIQHIYECCLAAGYDDVELYEEKNRGRNVMWV